MVGRVWLIAPVLKTGVSQGTVGSNPTPSAIIRSQNGNVYTIRVVVIAHGNYHSPCGGVAKLVDAPDLGSGGVTRVGSIPITPTKLMRVWWNW